MDRRFNFLNVLSPIFSAILMTFVGLVFILIPSTIYYSILPEKIYYWGSLSTHKIVILSGLMFIFGAFTVRNIKLIGLKRFNGSRFLGVLLFWLMISATLQIFSTYQLVSQIGIGNLFNSNMDLRGILGDLNSSTKLAWLDTFSSTLLVLSIWQILSQKKHRMRSAIVFSVIALCAMTVILIFFKALVAQLRGPILTLSVELYCIYFYAIYINTPNRLRELVVRSLLFIIFVLIVFGYLQWRRVGGSLVESTLGGLFGYFPASYNRLAAIMEHRLHLPNSGSLYMTLNWFWDFPFLGNLFDLYGLGNSIGLDLPVTGEIYQVESFRAVGHAELIDGLIWPTIYGALFADIGWFSLIWFFLYGVFAEVLWKIFKKTSYLGIALYPRIFAAGLSWYSVPDIARRDIAVAFITAMLLQFSIYIYNLRVSK